jgi:hypothetical protein
MQPSPGRHVRRPPRPWWIALSVVLVLIVVGAVTAVVLGHGPDDPAPTTPVEAYVSGSSTPSDAVSTLPTTATAPTPTRPASTAPGQPAGAPTVDGPIRTVKKGVSAWNFSAVTAALGDVGASWYYTWAAQRGNVSGPAGVEFVPMIWGAGSVTPATLNQAKSQGSTLLGFNEPDLKEQANMSVAQALDLWPQLQNTGMRLGSPAPAYGAATAGSWFDQFMAGAATRGYRVDFIALHWYGSDFGPAATNHLRTYLQATYDRYHKPLWLTEYALINFSGQPKYPTLAQQAAFATASVHMLESLSFVERYAWFALPATDGSGTGLYRPDGSANEVGQAYRMAR